MNVKGENQKMKMEYYRKADNQRIYIKRLHHIDGELSAATVEDGFGLLETIPVSDILIKKMCTCKKCTCKQ